MKLKGFWLPLLIWGAVLLISALLYPQMPDRIPTHWNWRGEIDGWGDKQWAAWLMPAIMLGLLLFFQILPWLSPRQFDIESFRPTYDVIIVLLMLMFASLHVVFLLPAVGLHPPVDTTVMVILAAFFMLLGTVLDKVRRNFFVGVRTPWTIASERVWNDTHRVAAKLFFWSGLLGIPAAVCCRSWAGRRSSACRSSSWERWRPSPIPCSATSNWNAAESWMFRCGTRNRAARNGTLGPATESPDR